MTRKALFAVLAERGYFDKKFWKGMRWMADSCRALCAPCSARSGSVCWRTRSWTSIATGVALAGKKLGQKFKTMQFYQMVSATKGQRGGCFICKSS